MANEILFSQVSREAFLLAAYAGVDPRTAERALRGEPLRARMLSTERIERALREHPELKRSTA